MLKETVKDIVVHLIKRLGSNDPFEICRCLHIHIFFEEMIGVRGYYIKRRRERAITLSTNLSEHEQRLVCAHELGHAIIHTDLSTPFYQANTSFSKDKFEMQANHFAMELLIPDDELIAYIKESYTIEQISRIYGYEKELIELKLNYLK